MALKKPNLLDDDNVQQLPAATVTAPAAKVAKIKRPSLGTRIGNAGKNSIEDTDRYIGNTIKVMRAGKTALDNAISYPSRVGAGFTRDAARAFVGLEPSHNEGLPTAPEMGPGPGNKLQSFEVTSNAPALTNPRAAPANTAGGAAATPTTPTLPNVQAEHALFAGNVPGQDYRMGAQGQHVYSDGSNGIPATMTLDQVSGKAALQHPGTVTALSADDTKYAFGAPSTSAILGHTPTHAEGVAYQTSQLQRPNQQLFHTSPEMFAKSDAASVASGDWRSGIGRAAGNARSVLNNPRASAAAKRDAGQSLRSLNAIPAAEYAAATGAQLQGQQNAAALTQEQARGANQRATTNLIGQNQLHNTRLAGENQRANTNLIGQNQLADTKLRSTLQKPTAPFDQAAYSKALGETTKMLLGLDANGQIADENAPNGFRAPNTQDIAVAQQKAKALMDARFNRAPDRNFWMVQARAANPHMTDDQLRAQYQQKYGA